MGFGTFPELFKGRGFDAGVGDVHNELKTLPEVVGALHDDVESLDALGGYVALGGDLSLTAFEVQTDQNLELVVQENFSPHARPRRCDRKQA